MKVLLLVMLVGAAQAQLSATRNQECTENETFNSCGSACEPSCDNPNPSFCTLQCVVGCQCDSGFFRNSQNQCVTRDQCSTPQTAPPLPPPSNLTCGANEESNECHNPCTEKKCPIANPPMVNCLMACQNGCSCKKGFLRNMKGECVKEADCPPVADENPCNLVDCRRGTTCKLQNGGPVCIPAPEEVPVGITCANVRCGSKGGCGMVEPAGCPGCKLQPQCLEVNMCHTTKCGGNQECVLVQVTCVKAPCHPIAECRPKSIKPLVQIREPRQSGPSCMTARCGTPAGCAMVKPMSCGNSKNCQLRPACIHENACAATSCPVGSECVLHEVNCIMAPCNPIAQCEPPKNDNRCPRNERFSDCKTACADVKCNEEPRMCAQVCSGSGCVCQEGFFRNRRGQCVTQNVCDAEKKMTY